MPLAKYAEALPAAARGRRELDEITTRARERAQEADLLRFGLDEVAAVEPRAGEDAELAAEAERLGHAEALASAATVAHAALAGNPEDPEGVDAGTLVAGAHAGPGGGARRTTRRWPRWPSGSARSASCWATSPGSWRATPTTWTPIPLRLAAVEERRAALTQLTRKYGATDVSRRARLGRARAPRGCRTRRRRRADRRADRRAGRAARANWARWRRR